MPDSSDKDDQPQNAGPSPRGSAILRHGPEGQRAGGARSEEDARAARAREAVYGRFFGSCETVYHETAPQIPHIDVYVYRGGQNGRNFCTLVTGGMSDLPMRLPRQAQGQAPARVELIFYCAEPKTEYLETLRWLAAFPHAYKTWVASGHTIPNGDPPAPMWGAADLNTVLLMPAIVGPDNQLPEALQIGGDPVEFLWVVPLSQAECDLKLAQGFDAILELFQLRRHPHVFNPERTSYI